MGSVAHSARAKLKNKRRKIVQQKCQTFSHKASHICWNDTKVNVEIFKRRFVWYRKQSRSSASLELGAIIILILGKDKGGTLMEVIG
jgi:hypothetical protein